jgi:hypothetical protein
MWAKRGRHFIMARLGQFGKIEKHICECGESFRNKINLDKHFRKVHLHKGKIEIKEMIL